MEGAWGPGVGGIKSEGALGVLGWRRKDLGVSGTTWVDAGGESRACSFLLVHSPRFWGHAPGEVRTSPLPKLLLRQEPRQLILQAPAGPAQITEGQGNGRDRKEPGTPPAPPSPGCSLPVQGWVCLFPCRRPRPRPPPRQGLGLPTGSTLFSYCLCDPFSTRFHPVSLALG